MSLVSLSVAVAADTTNAPSEWELARAVELREDEAALRAGIDSRQVMHS